jgi:hypothetical protein
MADSLPKYTFTECVVLFWYLTTQDQCAIWQENWLHGHGQTARFINGQGLMKYCKGWVFWLFIHGFDAKQIMSAFQSEGASAELSFGKGYIYSPWND